MNVYFINIEGNYGAIDADDYSCHSYYIIKFSSSPYTLQLDFSSDWEVISSCEMVCKVDYFFPININSNHYVLQKTKPINTVFNQWKCQHNMLRF